MTKRTIVAITKLADKLDAAGYVIEADLFQGALHAVALAQKDPITRDMACSGRLASDLSNGVWNLILPNVKLAKNSQRYAIDSEALIPGIEKAVAPVASDINDMFEHSEQAARGLGSPFQTLDEIHGQPSTTNQAPVAPSEGAGAQYTNPEDQELAEQYQQVSEPSGGSEPVVAPSGATGLGGETAQELEPGNETLSKDALDELLAEIARGEGTDEAEIADAASGVGTDGAALNGPETAEEAQEVITSPDATPTEKALVRDMQTKLADPATPPEEKAKIEKLLYERTIRYMHDDTAFSLIRDREEGRLRPGTKRAQKLLDLEKINPAKYTKAVERYKEYRGAAGETTTNDAETGVNQTESGLDTNESGLDTGLGETQPPQSQSGLPDVSDAFSGGADETFNGEGELPRRTETPNAYDLDEESTGSGEEEPILRRPLNDVGPPKQRPSSMWSDDDYFGGGAPGRPSRPPLGQGRTTLPPKGGSGNNWALPFGAGAGLGGALGYGLTRGLSGGSPAGAAGASPSTGTTPGAMPGGIGSGTSSPATRMPAAPMSDTGGTDDSLAQDQATGGVGDNAPPGYKQEMMKWMGYGYSLMFNDHHPLGYEDAQVRLLGAMRQEGVTPAMQEAALNGFRKMFGRDQFVQNQLGQ